MTDITPFHSKKHIDTAIEVWLRSKKGTSQSERTEGIYKGYIRDFRRVLQHEGFDLDGLPLDRAATETDHEYVLGLLSLAAQGWASRAHKQDSISASTYNQRLSVLSSFYDFAKKRQFLKIDNPIALLDRQKVQEYAKAQPLPKDEVNRRLKKIDRTTIAGKRDYVLLLVLISTGRRASELLALRWKDVQIADGNITLHFHCKGNLDMYDTLERRVCKALLDYLHTLFSHNLAQLPNEQALWLSFSHKRFHRPLTQRGLADILKDRLGTMKVHTTRHTFAYNMAQSGATLMDIQAKLGHSNIATTGRYIQRLSSAENKHVSTLLDFFGIEEE